MAELVIPVATSALGWFTGGSGPSGRNTSVTTGNTLTKSDVQTLTSSSAALSKNVGSAVAPDAGDLRVQTSGFGTVIPFVNGVQRVTGNIIWATDKTATPIQTSTGGGFTYSVSMAIAICTGPILGISRVWENGELKGQAGTTQNKLPGTLYLGDDVQTADPTIEAVEGAGNVPAYRGIAYIVMDDFKLGTNQNIPTFSFEVVKEVAL